MSTELTGLRGEVGFGFARMNDLVIIQTTQGIVEHLISKHTLPEVQRRGVVVGHDHRHKSLDFSRLVAAVFLSKGIRVYLFRDICHTPLVPFGVLKENAVCGVMITASHNPKQDNGYKLYGANGCQIIPPNDQEIAQLILENLEPWSEAVWDMDACSKQQDTLCQDPSSELLDAYYSGIISSLNLSAHTSSCNLSSLKVCYTAMHGVGLKFAERMVKELALNDMVIVESQAKPDPDFPTVAFPNPEEKVCFFFLLNQV